MQIAPPPPPPAPPAPPAIAAPTTAASGQPGVATTSAPRDLAGLRAYRRELSNQLSSAEGRRNELAESLVSRVGADRAGVEERIRQLDQRILEIERALDVTGREVAAAEGSQAARQGTTLQRPRGGPDLAGGEVVAIASVVSLTVLMPLAIAFARLIWRRAVHVPARAADPESAARLERVEHAIEAIAVEVERISEGQRFVTGLLADGRGPAAALVGARPARTDPEPAHR